MLDFARYYERTEKLYRQVYGLVERHRKWVHGRAKRSAFAEMDEKLFDKFLLDLGMTLHAIDAGAAGDIDHDFSPSGAADQPELPL